jgi:peptidoglycan/LPS O-acetylase OafA/YrhL
VPAYWLFLFVLLLFGWLVLPAAQTAELYRDNKFLFAATYLTNWNSAYGVTGGNLNHTWSLAIEEQFYLVWPAALVFALWRKWSPRYIVLVTVAVIVFLSVIRVVRLGSGTPLPVLYYSTESRIDALLIGCVASLVFMFRLVSDDLWRSKAFSVLAIAATVTMVWIISWLDEKNPDAFRIYVSIFTICTAVVLLWLVTHPPGAFNWFFGNDNLRWIGKISYGLYLWHYFCFEISRQIFNSLVLQMTFGVALAFATAAISFNFLERRFLLEKKRLEVA